MHHDADVDRLLAPLLADPASSAVLTDFDGTLSPIVDDPASARPLPGAVEALHSCQERYGRVAVISGRPVAYLTEQLGTDLHLSGLYGLVVVEGGERREDPGAAPWRAVVEGVADRAESS